MVADWPRDSSANISLRLLKSLSGVVDSVVETRHLITWVVSLAVELCDVKPPIVHYILERLLSGERNDVSSIWSFSTWCCFYIGRFVGVSIRIHIVLFI